MAASRCSLIKICRRSIIIKVFVCLFLAPLCAGSSTKSPTTTTSAPTFLIEHRTVSLESLPQALSSLASLSLPSTTTTTTSKKPSTKTPTKPSVATIIDDIFSNLRDQQVHKIASEEHLLVSTTTKRPHNQPVASSPTTIVLIDTSKTEQTTTHKPASIGQILINVLDASEATTPRPEQIIGKLIGATIVNSTSGLALEPQHQPQPQQQPQTQQQVHGGSNETSTSLASLLSAGGPRVPPAVNLATPSSVSGQPTPNLVGSSMGETLPAVVAPAALVQLPIAANELAIAPTMSPIASLLLKSIDLTTSTSTTTTTTTTTLHPSGAPEPIRAQPASIVAVPAASANTNLAQSFTQSSATSSTVSSSPGLNTSSTASAAASAASGSSAAASSTTSLTTQYQLKPALIKPAQLEQGATQTDFPAAQQQGEASGSFVAASASSLAPPSGEPIAPPPPPASAPSTDLVPAPVPYPPSPATPLSAPLPPQPPTTVEPEPGFIPAPPPLAQEAAPAPFLGDTFAAAAATFEQPPVPAPAPAPVQQLPEQAMMAPLAPSPASAPNPAIEPPASSGAGSGAASASVAVQSAPLIQLAPPTVEPAMLKNVDAALSLISGPSSGGVFALPSANASSLTVLVTNYSSTSTTVKPLANVVKVLAVLTNTTSQALIPAAIKAAATTTTSTTSTTTTTTSTTASPTTTKVPTSNLPTPTNSSSKPTALTATIVASIALESITSPKPKAHKAPVVAAAAATATVATATAKAKARLISKVSKHPASTTSTKRPAGSKASSSSSLDSFHLKELHGSSASVHEVIVKGKHVDGDDKLHDYEDDDDEGRHQHHRSSHRKLAKLEHKKATKSSDAGGEQDKDRDGKSKDRKKKKGSSRGSEHEEHAHLLAGLEDGDVIHVDAGAEAGEAD